VNANKAQSPVTRLRFRPKLDKIVELLLYLAHKKQHVDHYKACKLVYLGDWAHLNKYGRPITADTPKAMEYGPVATNSYELLKRNKTVMKAAGIDDLPFETKQLDKVIIVGAPKRAFDRDLFSRSDLEVFDWVLTEYGDLTFDQLHEITSKHFAYRNAWENRGTKRSAIMSFDDAVEENAQKADYIDDIAPVAHKM
jgi:uncharacterized phage-associated protein